MSFNWEMATMIMGAALVLVTLVVGWIIFASSIASAFSLEQFLSVFGVPLIILFIMVGYSHED